MTPCILTVLTCRGGVLGDPLHTTYPQPLPLPSPHSSLYPSDRDPAVSLRWEQGPCFSQGHLCCYQHEVERPQCVHEELAPLVGKERILEPLVDHGIHFLQPGRGGGGNNHWIGGAVLEIPSMGDSGRPKWPGKGVHPHCSLPYGNHICTITVLATAQVKKRCDIVRGHGSPHVPCNHSDPGGRCMGGFTAGHHFPTLPFSFTGLLLGS